jgi:hypothetical protein
MNAVEAGFMVAIIIAVSIFGFATIVFALKVLIQSLIK